MNPTEMAPELEAGCDIAPVLAERLRGSRDALTTRWMERVAERANLPRERVFPTDELLDHVPLLIDAIADYVEDPAEEIAASDPVSAKAMELGTLRHDQGFRPHEILKEFEILGGILLAHLAREIRELDEPCPPEDLLVCAHRLHRAISVIQRATTTHYLRLKDRRIQEREQRLRGFNAMVSHELKNRLNALLNSAELLTTTDLDADGTARMREILERNGKRVRDILDDLMELSRLDAPDARGRNLPLRTVAEEAVRQLRDMAEARGVRVEIGDLPAVEVSAPIVELALVNFVSNAIKYRDGDAPDPHVLVEATTDADANGRARLVVTVVDNGLGVPEDARPQLFERFFRAHEGTTDADGTGLGLSIVRQTVEAAEGEVMAEFPGKGSRFSFALPLRRDGDTVD